MTLAITPLHPFIGASVEGPCIIEQFDATTIVNPGWRATVDTFRNLVLARGA